MNNSFDYIIVGAGSAGCVLSNRLSKNPKNSVLLLEAGGPDNNFNIKVPGAYLKLHKSKQDWGFWTEKQKNVNNRKIYLPRGKTLGGSSSTNAMAYVRGNANDYNNWEKQGNPGWAFKDILPYFKKSENHLQINHVSKDFHSDLGELSVTLPTKFKTPYVDGFISACNNIGINKNDDYNGETQYGAGLVHSTIDNGRRHSAAEAFLKPVLNRSNLNTKTRCRVCKIIIKNKKAIGVEYILRGQKMNAFAAKEVIISAGAFQSPQILMLSGIGDEKEISKFGIKCVHELNGVGKNLQDHLFYPITSIYNKQDGINHYIPIINQLKSTLKYLIQRKGAFCNGPLEGMAFFDINQKSKNVNFQLHFSPICIKEEYGYDAYDINDYPTYDGFTILPTLLHPKSRGEVTLSSSDPLSSPTIQPNFLSHKDDLDQLVKGGEIAFKLLKDITLSKFIKRNGLPYNRNSESLIDHIKKTLETVYHPVGTCKMGKDSLSVVNHKLQVYGISSLRVVDASIMPSIVSGNTNAPVYMIAEKASDMILN